MNNRDIPNRPIPPTMNPVTAPPRNAILSALCNPFSTSILSTLTLLSTAMYIPKIPTNDELKAPTMYAIPVLMRTLLLQTYPEITITIPTMNAIVNMMLYCLFI